MGSILVLMQRVFLAVFLIFVCPVRAKRLFPAKVFNVMEYGAVANGVTDCHQCLDKSMRVSSVVIPKGNYLLGPTTFMGPCNGEVEFRIAGRVSATTDLHKYEDNWISFQYIDGLVINGGGTLDGKGASAWSSNRCVKNSNCKPLPISLTFGMVNNSWVGGINLVDSKYFHMHVFRCENMEMDYITITSPENSPNTDGIHVADSSFVTISHLDISTGDDCISFGPGSNNVHVSNVNCGPGHGISIGSLGKNKNDKDVTGLVVKNCNFENTQNGLRIKTWERPYSSIVDNLTFENIFMNNVNNPIIIDQQYCPFSYCDRQSPSLVQIRGVHFRNIWGTSSSKQAVRFICSRRVPCQYIELNKVNLLYHGRDGPALANCSNARGFSVGKQQPPSCLH